MAARKSVRPNIIFILTDDQGGWTLGEGRDPEIQTPALDELASNGIRFDQFFCVTPVCSPARASILTGSIPSQHGVLDAIFKGGLVDNSEENYELPGIPRDDRAIEYLAGLQSYTDILAENGYTCGLTGKWHLGDSLHPQKSFSDWFVMPYGACNYYDAPFARNGQISFAPGYITDVITDNALQFIESNAQTENPFYLGVHYTAPHSPWGKEQHPNDLLSYYENCSLDCCPKETIHPKQLFAPAIAGVDQDQKRREVLSGYFAALTGMDRNVKRILDRLSSLGISEETMILFSSDNGMNMGHHGIWGKGNATYPQNMYDTSVKVPMLVSWQGHIPQGGVNNNLLSHYDIMPTLLDYLGLSNPDATHLPGRSFAPLFRGESISDREHVYVFDEYGPVRMIRSKEWKYIHCFADGSHKLFDLVNDPLEQFNRIADSSMKRIVQQMSSQMENWFTKYTNPERDGRWKGVYGRGQIDRVEVVSEGKKAFISDYQYYRDLY